MEVRFDISVIKELIDSSAYLQSALWFINDNDITFIYPSSNTPGTTHHGIWWSCF